jgi:hypothetical protein
MNDTMNKQAACTVTYHQRLLVPSNPSVTLQHTERPCELLSGRNTLKIEHGVGE